MTARKVKLCNACRDTSGLIYDETTDPPTVTKCPCRVERQTAEQARDKALTTVAWSKSVQLRHAYQIIEAAAEVNQFVSANTVRTAMETAQIDGSVRGAAFRRAVDEGLLEPDGETVSTDIGTHSKKVATYRSRSFSRQLGVG